MDKRVVITGLGVISSIGIGKDAFWNGLIQGKSGISRVTSFDTSKHFTHNGGEVNDFKPDEFIPKSKIKSLSRASQMALAAAKLAIQDANLSGKDMEKVRCGTCVGTNIGSIQTVEKINEIIVNNEKNGIDVDLIRQIPANTTSAVIAKAFNLQSASIMFSTACSAGNYAIGYGLDLIKLGRVEIMLVGGSDAFSKVAFTGFNQFSAVDPEKCRPFDKNRKGMMVAEGAGMFVLESLENALKRKASIYGEVLGYGLSCDAHHMTTSSIDGIVECIRKALNEACITADNVDYINAHGTGTPTNDRNECSAVKKVFGDRYNKIPISSIKSMLGHTMGAASALEAIACALIVKNDIIPPTINYETVDPDCDIDCVPNQARKYTVDIALNNSYAFGGNNASLIIKKFLS